MKKRDGFTLVELIVGMIVVTIAAVVGLEFLVYCERMVLKPELKLIAANFARETMEELYMLDYESLTETPSTSKALPSTGDLGLLYSRYDGSRHYSVVKKPGYKVITVTVNWNP